MNASARIDKLIEVEFVNISVWDKKANGGTGGYLFGKIFFNGSHNGLTLLIKGEERLYKLVKKEWLPNYSEEGE